MNGMNLKEWEQVWKRVREYVKKNGLARIWLVRNKFGEVMEAHALDENGVRFYYQDGLGYVGTDGKVIALPNSDLLTITGEKDG